jgi:hypothetical protein
MPPKPDREPGRGFHGKPSDGGLSIDRLAQAFAAMMGADGASSVSNQPRSVVDVDASPDLDAGTLDAVDPDENCHVTPSTIVEAMLFMWLPEGAHTCEVCGHRRSMKLQWNCGINMTVNDGRTR